MGYACRITLSRRCGKAPRRLQAAWARMGALADQMSRYRENSVVRQLAARAPTVRHTAVPAETMQVLLAARVATLHRRRFRRQRSRHATLASRRRGDRAAEIADAQRLAEQRRLVGWRRRSSSTPRRAPRGCPRPAWLSIWAASPSCPSLAGRLDEIASQRVAAAMIDGGGDVVCHGNRRARLASASAIRAHRIASWRGGAARWRGRPSGDYERFFDRAGRWHHVLDPASGWPTQHGVPAWPKVAG